MLHQTNSQWTNSQLVDDARARVLLCPEDVTALPHGVVEAEGVSHLVEGHEGPSQAGSQRGTQRGLQLGQQLAHEEGLPGFQLSLRAANDTGCIRQQN